MFWTKKLKALMIGILAVLTVCSLVLYQPQLYLDAEASRISLNSLVASTSKHSTNSTQRVVYIKVEKSGSSSFSRIFKSYGLRHELRMILPKVHGSPGLINVRELEPGLSWDIAPDRHGPPMISFSHHRFVPGFFDRYFPPDETVYVSSIREPVKWFISYVDYNDFTGKENADPRDVLNKDRYFYKRRNWVCQMDMHVHNTQLQWLGFPMNDDYVYNESAIKEYINIIDSRFSLIMLTEYFYESVLLLRRTMNWSMKDVFFGFVNEAYKRSGVVFTDEEKIKLIDVDHNRGDWLLYDHFNKTLWKRIESEPDFYEELGVFKSLNAEVVEFCHSEDLYNHKTKKLYLATRWEPHIEIDEVRCQSIRGHHQKGDHDELEDVLKKYANFSRMTLARELKLWKYKNMPWPPSR